MTKISTLVIALAVFSASAYAQIPNGGFENWTAMTGYTTPDGWDNMDAMTASTSTYTCMKGTPGSPGTAYLKLVSKTVSGMGVIPGVATCGLLDMSNMNAPVPLSGFAFNLRPQSFDGKWQYMASGNDGGFIGVLLTKWNSGMMRRDTIAYAIHSLSGMAMSWANFSIPLTYQSLDFPDSAIIMLSASGATPVANSYLYADTLRFTGSVQGTTGFNNETADVSNFNLFPNPTSNQVAVTFNNMNAKNLTLQITDVTGKIMWEETAGEPSGAVARNINVASLSKGIYFVALKSNASVQVKKLLVE